MRGPAYLSPLMMEGRSMHKLSVSMLFVAGVSLLLCGTNHSWADEPLPLRERIDRWIEAAYVGEPAALATDAEFLRRVWLDLTGRIPAADEVRAFLADPAADKRERVVERLLSSAAFVRHMTDVFDVMWMERRPDQHVPSAEWRKFLFDSFAANKPLNQLIREILSSDGSDPALRPAAKFFLDREADANLMTRDIGRMFFGMDLQCAQCHDHPLIDGYTQADYYGLFAFLNRTVLFLDAKDKNKAYLGEKAEGDTKYTSAFTKEEGSTLPRLPSGEPIEDPVLAKEDWYIVKPAKDVRPVARYSRRLRLAEEATSGKNVAFNRNLANRLWALMMGRGLIDPVDLSHPGNPPAHGELLDELAADLVAHQFDIRYFLREIALSRTYQRAIDPPGQWLQQVLWANDRSKALSDELAAAQQAYDQTANQVQQLRSELSGKQKDVEPIKSAWREAEQAWADAQKAAEDAMSGLEAARKALLVQQETHQALIAARDAAQKAVQLASGDQEIKAAWEKIQAAVAKADEALKKAQDTQKEKTQAYEAAKAALDAVTPKRQQALAAWQEAQKPIAELSQRYATAQEELRRAEGRLVTAKRRQQDAQWLVDQRPLIEAWVAAQQPVHALQETLADLRRQERNAEETLQAKQSAEQQAAQRVQQQQAAVAQASASSEAETAAQRKTLQEAEAALAAAQQERQQAEQQLTQLRQKVAEQTEAFKVAQQRLSEATAAAADTLAELENRWIRQHALAPLKPLTPEQLAWSMLQATGVLANQIPAIEGELKKKDAALADKPDLWNREVEKALEAKFAGVVAEFVRLYGSGPGQPPQTFFATVDQALYLANGATLRSWLAPQGNNLTARLMSIDDPGKLAEELYLSVLTRMPDESERQWVAQTLAGHPDKKAQVVQELAWALITSAEFRFSP